MIITNRINTHFTNLIGDENFANAYFLNKSIDDFSVERLHDLEKKYDSASKKYNFAAQLLSVSKFVGIDSLIKKSALRLEKEHKRLFSAKNELEVFESNLAYLILSEKIAFPDELGFSSEYVKELLTNKKKEVENSTYDILVNDTEIKDVIQDTIIKNLKVCPANMNLAGAEVELVSMMSREQRLKEKLDVIKDEFDYILIDCPPSLGLITLNSFTASNSVLIPVQCEYFALEGLGQLINTINLVKKHLNKEIQIEGALLTMYDARTNLSNQVVKEVKKYFEDKVYKTVIPRNVKLSEAPSYGMPITAYAPRSKGARCYEKLANELLKAKKH